jgi:hypothetical protein
VFDWGRAPRDVAIGLADDASYAAGVWKGVLTARELGPLLPEINSWPGSASDR